MKFVLFDVLAKTCNRSTYAKFIGMLFFIRSSIHASTHPIMASINIVYPYYITHLGFKDMVSNFQELYVDLVNVYRNSTQRDFKFT